VVRAQFLRPGRALASALALPQPAMPLPVSSPLSSPSSTVGALAFSEASQAGPWALRPNRMGPQAGPGPDHVSRPGAATLPIKAGPACMPLWWLFGFFSVFDWGHNLYVMALFLPRFAITSVSPMACDGGGARFFPMWEKS
jgi:hypothetical protein